MSHIQHCSKQLLQYKNRYITHILGQNTLLRQQYINPSIIQCCKHVKHNTNIIRYASTSTSTASSAVPPPPTYKKPNNSNTNTGNKKSTSQSQQSQQQPQPIIINSNAARDQYPANLPRRVAIFIGVWVVIAGLAYFGSSIHHRERDIDIEYKDKLTDEQYKIVRLNYPEMPYTGKYVSHWLPGIYHCICCNAPLFSSQYKFDSGYGWASFSRCIDNNVKSRWANVQRVELDCIHCKAHIGTIYGDGPQDSKYLRYNVNSNALSFVQDNNVPTSKYISNDDNDNDYNFNV